MTTWIESPGGGRQRGLLGLVRAWITVIVRPRRFFRDNIAAGDQAPGLVFAIAVTLIHTATRFAFASLSETRSVPVLALILLLVALLVTPVALHLVAALETALLIPLAKSRGGVSQTVQVIAYAVAPCALSGVSLRTLCVLPDTALCSLSGVIVPVLWLTTAVYGAALLVIGTVVVHDTSVPRAVVVTALPSLLVFGYGFRGIHALELLSTSAVL
ncbi:YIP1 family protein [Halocatena marina]|uniref:YIP1 family protein n=1 Tax=Halocatena marina TaxID=2934937 RepID=A0ABD5YN43_9EURY|nr:YIP1 family protein [Halocatena marina]